MAGLGELNLKIGADATGLLRILSQAEDGTVQFGKSIVTLQQQLGRFQDALKNATNPQNVERLNRAIEATKSRISAIQQAGTAASSGFNQIQKGAAGANTTLVNFGRVVQDAPFGIIGIANNIDPLIQSFQSLQRSTGSTGSALKSLGAALIGPAGVAIAISAVTSALIAFGPAIKEALGSGAVFQGLIKSTEQAAEAAEKTRQEFGLLIRRVNEFSEGSIRQANAIDDVNKKFKEYGVEISNTAEFQRNSANISATFVRIKELEARALALATEKAKAYSRELVLNQTLQSGNAFDILGEVSALGLLRQALGESTGAIRDINNQFEKARQKQRDFQAEINGVNDELFSIINNLNTLPGLQDITKDLKVKQVNVKPDKVKVFQPKEFDFDILIRILEKETGIRAADVGKSFFDKLLDRASAIDAATKRAQDISNALSAVFGAKQVKPVTLPIETSITLSDETFKQTQERFKQIVEEQSQLLQQFAVEAFAGIGEIIGSALTGGGEGIKNAFKGIISIAGDYLIRLGKLAIAQSKLITAIRAANPVTGLAAGIAAVALGTALKSFTPRFATGVTNFQGGTAIVGERGPEVVQLPRGANVIPNDRLGDMGGAQAITINGTWALRGDQLVAVINRTNQNNGRKFG